jgi:hypothetical protein
MYDGIYPIYGSDIHFLTRHIPNEWFDLFVLFSGHTPSHGMYVAAFFQEHLL